MRILMLGPWPINEQKFGGQIRAKALYDGYLKAGLRVKFCGLGTASSSADDVILPADVASLKLPPAGESPCAFWKTISFLPEVMNQYIRVVSDFRPDIIQFEEPYLWYVIRMLRSAGSIKNTRLVYSSYNIESEMIEQTVISSKSGGGPISVAEIKRMETQAAAQVDLVMAVTEHDRSQLIKFGAKKVVVIRNGAYHQEVRDIHAALALTAARRYALFVSSAHEPNYLGLEKYLLRRRQMGNKSLIVIAGTVTRLLIQRRFPVDQKMILTGFTSDSILAGLYHEASVIIVPKIAGGGSNLKTAEALLSGRPIVATEDAFRGYEDFGSEKDVIISELSTEFEASVLKSLHSAKVDACYRMRSASLHWSKIGEAAVAAVNEIILHQ